MAKELASREVTVNAVSPGFIRTAMTDELTPEQAQGMLNQIPLARFGEVQDIAKACLYLAGEGGRYITGQVLRVDGGLMM
jgi:3-oxoacyl-[acyl-carrier protein] reductase